MTHMQNVLSYTGKTMQEDIKQQPLTIFQNEKKMLYYKTIFFVLPVKEIN